MIFRFHLFVIVLATALGLLASAPSSAAFDGVNIGVEEMRIALTYTRWPGIVTELEGSTNLMDWNTLDLLQTISPNPDGSETVKTLVDRMGSVWSFFRLRYSPERKLVLAWDAAPDAAVVGYAVRVWKKGETTFRRVDVGASTEATITMADDGSLYGIVVVSYSADGTESDPSNSLSIEL